MNSLKEKIGNVEFILILIGFLIGERLVSLPRVAVTTAGYGSVLSILIGGLLVFILSMLMLKLSKSFPDKSFFEICEEIIGKYLSKIIIIIFFIYFFLFTSLFARRIAEFSKSILLFNTPTEIIVLSFILVSGYCASKGIPNYAKTSNTLLFISLSFIVYSFVATTPLVDIGELRPLIQTGAWNQIDIINLGLPTFIGIEMILFLAPFLKIQKNISKNTYIGITLTTIFFILNVTFTIGILGERSLYYSYFPVFAVAKEMSLQPLIDLRGDIIFASFWLLLVYVVMVGYHYLSSISMAKVVGHKNNSVYSVILMPLFYVLSLLPQNLAEMDRVLRFLEKFWLYGILGTVLIVIVIGMFTKKVKFER